LFVFLRKFYPEHTCDFTRALRSFRILGTVLIDVDGQSLGNITAVHRLHSKNQEKNAKWGIEEKPVEIRYYAGVGRCVE
jgi:hypothetical protein